MLMFLSLKTQQKNIFKFHEIGLTIKKSVDVRSFFIICPGCFHSILQIFTNFIYTPYHTVDSMLHTNIYKKAHPLASSSTKHFSTFLYIISNRCNWNYMIIIIITSKMPLPSYFCLEKKLFLKLLTSKQS